MGSVNVFVTATVEQSVDSKPVDGKRKDENNNPMWRGRFLRLSSAMLWFGSLYYQSLRPDATYVKEFLDPEGALLPHLAFLDDPIPSQDYMQLHGVTVIVSLENGTDTSISASLIGLNAGDEVSFRAELTVEPADRGMNANLRLLEPVSVVAKSSTNGKADRISQLLAIAGNA